MVRPKGFGFNEETAVSNSFQNKVENSDVLTLAQTEFDEMVKLLESKSIGVAVFEDRVETLPDSIFPNNWISHTASKLVVYPMLTENRRGEVRKDVIDHFEKVLSTENTLDLSAEALNERFLEGTGSIIFDHLNKLAFACISPRTNVKLLNELCGQLDYSSVSFDSVDLKGDQIYHTNVMLSLAENFAIVCLESISDLLERSLLKRTIEKTGRTIIDISYKQMNCFAANALEVANEKGKSYYCLSQTALDALTNEQKTIIQESAELLPIQIPTIEKVGGGSVRCMMAGFFNYPK